MELLVEKLTTTILVANVVEEFGLRYGKFSPDTINKILCEIQNNDTQNTYLMQCTTSIQRRFMI